jgi:hypothetical protein
MSQDAAPATIGPKEAVLIAHRYLIDLYGLESLKELLLEELELSEDETTWAVTFGFSTGRTIEIVEEPSGVAIAEGLPYSLTTKKVIKSERAYKLITVHAKDGSIVSLTDAAL